MRKELRIGMLIIAVCYLLKHVSGAPEFICYFFFGIGIPFVLFGILPEKTCLAIKAYKRKLLHRL